MGRQLASTPTFGPKFVTVALLFGIAACSPPKHFPQKAASANNNATNANATSANATTSLSDITKDGMVLQDVNSLAKIAVDPTSGQPKSVVVKGMVVDAATELAKLSTSDDVACSIKSTLTTMNNDDVLSITSATPDNSNAAQHSLTIKHESSDGSSFAISCVKAKTAITFSDVKTALGDLVKFTSDLSAAAPTPAASNSPAASTGTPASTDTSTSNSATNSTTPSK